MFYVLMIGVYMLPNHLIGYLYLTCGIICILFFASQLLFQLLAILVGASFIFQGLKLLSVDRMIYHYSQIYFNNQFRR